ncbi:PEST proteolytic signal-containing nuclear protein-like isoform X2 [Xenia sp. Carnegie-2017]|uniref:PEST proteolytic signal-containing nuclear protein-like isoform X2 n=1 Tax=Xenia sp. Carnegie-2017 TaxID=2897299 RepID=UPI001F038511|nr:PEST proteolytic signal-containing nuclear protein-like isoform X2 [Xenia sp. Carnegie-2017]XP_046848463.1 PEST proteolytic signal-containing nuclear protein-like isoform X2 [Xenia sp. Carnegie-2017]
MAEKDDKEVERISKKGSKDEQKVAVKRKSNDPLDDEKYSSSKVKVEEPSSKTLKSGIAIKVAPLKSAEAKKEKLNVISKPKKGSIAAAFNDESDEEEEIPREAKMRMRNMGKDTVTSSGPNSFNKGKQGFTNHNKLKEKEMKLLK